MITVPVRFIVLAIGIAVAVAVLMAPRSDEWFAMMRDEHKQAQIIALLEPRLAQGENDAVLLATLGRSYAETGDYQRATELLELYVEIRPDDPEAYAHLADLYKSVGGVTRRIAMLEHNIAIKPTPVRGMELAVLYRQEYRADKEFALLSQFEAELTIESGLLLRLAERLAGVGNQERAIRVLMRKEVISDRLPNEHERFFLVDLLVGSGRSAEAVRLGKTWILQWHEAWLASRLLDRIVLRTSDNVASELGAAIAMLHPEVRFFLAERLAKMGAKPVARHLLASWAGANPSPSMNELAAFLSACRNQDEPGLVWQAFSEVLRQPSADDVIIRYSEAIAAEFGIGALAPFWASLANVVAKRRPLLVARLAFHEHDLVMTKWLLGRVDLTELETSDRRMWSDLLIAVASPSEAFEVLRAQRLNGRLHIDLLVRYARLAGSLGQEIEYRLALADLRREIP